MKNEAGGFAFPKGGNPGMSLRDYFAAQAINTMVYKSSNDDTWDPVAVAVGCYAIADALLEARKK